MNNGNDRERRAGSQNSVPFDTDARFREAVQHYWTARDAQKQKQEEGGRIDADTRGAVTGGTQMGALEVLVTDLLLQAGLDESHIRSRTALELPGYFRPEKKWDLLVVADGRLAAAIEFKSQVAPRSATTSTTGSRRPSAVRPTSGRPTGRGGSGPARARSWAISSYWKTARR